MSEHYKKTVITLSVFLIQLLVFGQEKQIKDMDNDGVNDTIYFNKTELTIVCKLSTHNFKPLLSKQIKTIGMSYSAGIETTRNGFTFYIDYENGGFKNRFRYNPKTKKVQLIGISLYEHEKDKKQVEAKSNVNLLTGDFIGNTTFYGVENLRTIKAKMHFKTINLGDFSDKTFFDYSERCRELYEKTKTIN